MAEENNEENVVHINLSDCALCAQCGALVPESYEKVHTIFHDSIGEMAKALLVHHEEIGKIRQIRSMFGDGN